MFIIRDVFTAKPGQASKLAKLFRKVFSNDPSVRVLTDFIGNFNTVTMDREVKNLAEYEEIIQSYMAGKPGPQMAPDAFELMAGYTDMYITGHREVLKIVE